MCPALVPSFLPLEALPRYWGLPVGEFLRQTGAPAGWGWLAASAADYLNLACMALLGLVTALCYARIVPSCSARRAAAGRRWRSRRSGAAGRRVGLLSPAADEC